METVKEKKEIKKLIELLNEFEKERKSWWTYESFDEYDSVFHCKVVKTIFELDDSFVLSKKYGFIKWLVDNDKIDLGSRNPLIIYEYKNEGEKQRPYSFNEEMLIRLAISDSPIDDLISYLK